MYLLPVQPVLCEWKQYQVAVCGFWAPSDKYFSPDLILYNTETLKPLMNIKRISHICPISKAFAEIACLAIESDLMQQLQTGESQDFTKHTVTAVFTALSYSLLCSVYLHRRIITDMNPNISSWNARQSGIWLRFSCIYLVLFINTAIKLNLPGLYYQRSMKTELKLHSPAVHHTMRRLRKLHRGTHYPVLCFIMYIKM